MAPRLSRVIGFTTALLVLLGSLLGHPRPAHAGDGDLVWKVIETEHFVIHYYEPHGDLARRVAVVAERAHRTLAPALDHVPDEKTIIVLTDDTDGANGFASVLPRNAIHLFATAPGGISQLNDHDDWLYGLVAHEYTHILHLDTIGGIPRWYNKLFGKTWAPNHLQPDWFIEGLATYEESKRSSSGRTRNSIFDMYLRIAVLAGRPLGLDQISSGTWYWPHGSVYYLYGSAFLKYVADRYGDDKIAQISHEYGTQPIPWGINRVFHHATGRTLVELYDDWVAYMTRKYSLQRDAMARRGRIEGRQLTFTGETNGSPQYAMDGKTLYWAEGDGFHHPRYRQMPIGTDAHSATELATIDDAGQFVVLPDGSGLLFQRGMTYRTNYDYGDLFRYDFATHADVRLTTGARATDPAVSPDGRTVAFTVNGGSHLKLALMPNQPGGAIEVVWEGPTRWSQAYTPAWSRDGTRIAFSAWNPGGYRDLFVYDLRTKQATALTHDRALDGSPVWSRDDKWIFFSSDRTGIYDVYAITPDGGTLKQVTNVLGGTFDLDVSRDGKRLCYVGYGETGYDLFELPLDEAAWLEAEPYVDDRPDATSIPDGEIAMTAPRAYDPLETLRPRSYTLSQSLDSFGSAFTVQTGGSDAVGFHGYALGATYGYTRGDVTFGASYGYNRYWPSFGFAVGRSLGRPGGLILDRKNTRYTEEDWGSSAAITLPVLRRPGYAADVSFSYDYDYLRDVDPIPDPNPNTTVTRMPEEGHVAGIAFRWNLSNVYRYAFSLGPQDGRALSLGLRYNDPALGSDFHSLEVDYAWREYWQLPWKSVFSLRASGAITTTDRRRDGIFAIGGVGTQDVGGAILNNFRANGTGFLRGYEPAAFRGHEFHLANLELRAPVWTIEKGLDVVPFYVRQMHAAALVDVGNAFDGDFDPTQLKWAVGGSLRLDVVFGFYGSGTFDVGLARGLQDKGETQYWFLLTNTL